MSTALLAKLWRVWKRNAIPPARPREVTEAVQEHQTQSNPLLHWFSWRCDLKAKGSENSRDLYENYSAWARSMGLRPMTPQGWSVQFNALTRSLQIDSMKPNARACRVYKGIELKPIEDGWT